MAEATTALQSTGDVRRQWQWRYSEADGGYGNALITWLPVDSHCSERLCDPHDAEHRSLLCVTVQLCQPRPPATLTVAVVHLDNLRCVCTPSDVARRRHARREV